MKRLISFILAFAIILSAMTFTALARNTDSSMLELTEILGIISEDTNTEFISRAEFLSLVMKTLKINYSGYSDKPVFSDMTVGHKYFGEVMFALKQGIISGSTDGNFYPDDYITFEQASIIMLNAMGYKNAGQSEGYLIYANKLDLFDNVKGDTSVPVTKQDAKTLVLNMLLAPYPNYSYVLGDTYVSNGEESFLYRTWGYLIGDGIVEATEIKSMTLEVEKKGYTIIDGKRYSSAGLDTDKYFGMNVKYFYTDDGNERELFHLYPTSENEVISLEGRGFVSYTNNTISFVNDKGRIAEYKVLADSVLMLNNRILKSKEFKQKVSSSCESFVLIDNDQDSIYEVVMAEQPTVYANGFIDVANTVILGEDKPNIELDKYKNYVLYDADGNKLNLEDLKNDWHYLVYESESFDCTIKIVATNVSVEDQVTELDEAGGTIKVSIGKEYEFLPQSIVPISEIKTGSKYVFYLYKDKVIDVKKTGQIGITAIYAIAGVVENMGDAVIRYMAEDGTFRMKKFSTKVSFRAKDGVTYSISGKDAVNKLYENGTFRQQLLFVKFNGKGEIITAYQVCNDETKPYHEQVYNKRMTLENAMRRWYNATQSLENEIQLSTSTVIFSVPDHYLNNQDIDNYGIASTAIFSNNSTYAINEYPGALNERYTTVPVVTEPNGLAASYMVLECPENASLGSGGSVYYGLVTEIYDYYDEATCIYGKKIVVLDRTGAEFEFKLEADSVIYDKYDRVIERGDIIAIRQANIVKKNGMLLYYDRSADTYHFITSFDKGSFAPNQIGYRFYAVRVTEGKILETEGNIAKCETMKQTIGERSPEYINTGSAKIIKFYEDETDYDILDGKYLKKDSEFISIMDAGMFRLIIYYTTKG